MNENMTLKIIEEICNKEKIKLTKLSYDWIWSLEKNNITKNIIGYEFDLNTLASSTIVNDKYATFSILKNKNISVIDHIMMFNPATRMEYIFDVSNYDLIYNTIKNEDGKVVVKINNGASGRGVYLCDNKLDFDNTISQIFKLEDNLSICPYYNIQTEYRCVYLDGEILLVYGKEKPFVIGNGLNTVSELAPKNKCLSSNHHTNFGTLNAENYIPRKDEKYELSWKFNLSLGATCFILEDDILKDKIIKLALEAGNALNIRFSTIDIIHTTNDRLYVLEANSTVCITNFINQVENGYNIALGIYRHAISKMMEL